MDPRRLFIRRVELTHALAAVLALCVALAIWSQAHQVGLLAGVLLGGANFRAMALLTARFTSPHGAQAGAVGLIVAKMAALVAAVGGVMLWLRPDPVFFLVGLTLAPASLALVAVFARPHFDDSGDANSESATIPSLPSEVL